MCFVVVDNVVVNSRSALCVSRGARVWLARISPVFCMAATSGWWLRQSLHPTHLGEVSTVSTLLVPTGNKSRTSEQAIYCRARSRDGSPLQAYPTSNFSRCTRAPELNLHHVLSSSSTSSRMGCWTPFVALGSTTTRVPAASGSPDRKVRPKKKRMATDTAQSLWRKAKRGFRRNTESGHATRASTKDRQRYRRCVAKEIQQRQAELSGRSEIYAPRCVEAVGEHAYALGVLERSEGAISC